MAFGFLRKSKSFDFIFAIMFIRKNIMLKLKMIVDILIEKWDVSGALLAMQEAKEFETKKMISMLKL